jgi:hypothetical protein
MNWVTKITQNPYFLRPEFLPSGRATPETAAKWKIEDELLGGKEDRGWRSVEERCELRKQRGRKRFEKARTRALKEEREEISYLSVSCDNLPEEAPVLPGRIRARSAERGNFFQTEQGVPISGPKTEEEAGEDQRVEDLLEREWIRWTKNARNHLGGEKLAGIGPSGWFPR